MRSGWVALLFCVFLRPCLGQPGFDLRLPRPGAVVGKPVPGYTLKLVLAKTTCELGTPLEAALIHTYTGTQPLWIAPMAVGLGLSHSDLRFSAFDSANRPATYYGLVGAGVGTILPMLPMAAGKPVAYTVFLNQWLQFDRPGTYRVTAESLLVRLGDTITSPPASAQSPTVMLTVTEPDEAGRQKRLAAAQTALAGGSVEARRAATHDLRCMRDNRAIGILFSYLDDADIIARADAVTALYEVRDGKALRQNLEDYIGGEDKLIPAAALTTLGALAGRAAAAEEPLPSARSQRYVAAIHDLHRRLAERLLAAVPTMPPGRAAAEIGCCLANEYLPTDRLDYWRIVLRDAPFLAANNTSEVYGALRRKCRLPALGDDLSALAENTQAPGAIRDAALVARARMELSMARHLDMLATEAMLPKPGISAEALALMGNHRADEVAAALRRLLADPDATVRLSAANRVYRLGSAIQPAELLAALDRIGDPATAESEYRYLLLALAERDPAAAWPKLRAVLDGPPRPRSLLPGSAWSAAVASSLPAAREYVAQIFAGTDLARLLPMLRGMAAAVEQAAEGMDPQTRGGLGYWVPDLIDAFSAGRTSEVRRLAQDMLTTITGVKPTTAAEPIDALAARYEEWLEANKQHIGR
ncbi:MAG: hypothetical protein HZB16_23300 [Armatimonadetes bacterium]|nr:hypothetical protein [Armatimonadota bacterium]